MKKEFKIRDRRDKGWFYLDNEYLNGLGRYFGPIGIAVYVSLCRHADVHQECFPSQELIADEIATSRKTVAKYIKLLEKHRVISIQKVKNSKSQYENTIYTLLNKKEWIYPSHVKPVLMDKQKKPCVLEGKSHVNVVHTNKTNRTNKTKIPTETSSEALFDGKEEKNEIKKSPLTFEEKLKQLAEDKSPHVRLIGYYLSQQSEDFDLSHFTEETVNDSIKRNSRDAVQLTKFKPHDVLWAFKEVRKDSEYGKAYEWKLSSVVKKLLR